MERTDYFSIYELHFLLESLEEDVLMGLPTRDDLTITSEQVWEIAKNELEKKGFVTETGELTQSGFIIVEVLREYSKGKSLTIINNCYVMKSAESKYSIVIVDTLKGYQLLKLAALPLLALLQEKMPLLLREPETEEVVFLTKPILMSSTYEALFLSNQTVTVQYYPLFDMAQAPQKEMLFRQLLFVVDGRQLLGYDVNKNKLSVYSQYYFLEQLYTWLNIPFKGEDFV